MTVSMASRSQHPGEEPCPLDAIRQDKPYNEARRGAEASLVTSMGRMAAHTGRIVTYNPQC
jgi:hypothetical protein